MSNFGDIKRKGERLIVRYMLKLLISWVLAVIGSVKLMIRFPSMQLNNA